MSDTLFDMEQITKAAQLSDCGTYRYRLSRHWDVTRAALVYVMLNPSTADAEVDDQTIKRCMHYARREEFGGIEVLNLYALRSPYPAALWAHPDPVGPENDAHLRLILREQCLGTTKDGHPRHPGRLANDQPLQRWTP